MSWDRRGHVLFAGALVALLAASPPPATSFTRELPPGVPDLGRWSKASGTAETEDGKALQYELFYDPHRSNYEVIRYRVTGWDGGGGPAYTSNERLQWQAAQKDVRRFECEARPSGGCTWRQLDQKKPEYHREMPVVLWVLSVHNQLLHEREAKER